MSLDDYFTDMRNKTMDKLTPQNAEQEHMVQILLAKMQGIEVEFYAYHCEKWISSVARDIDLDTNYRIKSHELPITKEMWAMIDKKWKWAAMDEDGEVYFYTKNPSSDNCLWRYDFGKYRGCVLAIDTDRIDWRKSLTKRPEGV